MGVAPCKEEPEDEPMRLLSLDIPKPPDPRARGSRGGFRRSPPAPPTPDVVARLLFVGGNEADRRTLEAKLGPKGVGVGWHWANRMASRRGFPKCDGVVIFTQACAHSLFYSATEQAKKAGVPVVHHDSWPRTEAALLTAGIGRPPPVAATPVPTGPVPPGPKGPKPTDEVIVETHALWEALAPDLRAAIGKAAHDADQNTGKPVPPEVTEVLWKFNGNPRALITMVLLATASSHVTQAGVQRLHMAVTRKKAESSTINLLATKVPEWCGPEHGLRKGEPFDIRKARAAKAAVPPAEDPTAAFTAALRLALEGERVDPPPVSPPPEVPVAAPAPVSPNKTRTRFLTMLEAAIEAGEKVSVQRVQGDYVITYEDGTSVRVETPRPK